MFNDDNQTENIGGIDEVIEHENTMWLARIGLLVALGVLLYSGYNIALILTLRGEIFSYTLVNETITRSYEVKRRKGPTTYHQCFRSEKGEQCLSVGIPGSSKKPGDMLETMRIWDGNSYYILTPFLEDLDMYFISFVVFAIVALFCSFKIIFPRFKILQKFNDTRTTKIFDE